MATRFKATDLKEMIRALVRQEIKEVVTETINEVLSDRYLKAIVEKKVGKLEERLEARLDALQEQRIPIQGDDPEPEETPEVLDNDQEGIYTKSPLKKEDVERNEMLSLFFEGTEPISARDALVGPGMGGVDLSKLGVGPAEGPMEVPEAIRRKPAPQAAPAKPAKAPAMDPSRWARIAEAATRRAIDKKPMTVQRSVEDMEKELERKRKALEVPA